MYFFSWSIAKIILRCTVSKTSKYVTEAVLLASSRVQISQYLIKLKLGISLRCHVDAVTWL